MRSKITKHLLLILLTIMSCFLLYGCGNTAADTVNMQALCETMSAADPTLPDMTTVYGSDENAKDLFAYLSDLDYDKVSDYYLTYSSEGKADEIAVIAVKNQNDVSKAEKTLEAHAESRRSIFENYDPDQVERADNALIFTEKQYAVLIISDNADAVKEAFLKTVQ